MYIYLAIVRKGEMFFFSCNSELNLGQRVVSDHSLFLISHLAITRDIDNGLCNVIIEPIDNPFLNLL
jgi:hypothetical protein